MAKTTKKEERNYALDRAIEKLSDAKSNLLDIDQGLLKETERKKLDKIAGEIEFYQHVLSNRKK
jgi:hypothetical protein